MAILEVIVLISVVVLVILEVSVDGALLLLVLFVCKEGQGKRMHSLGVSV